MSKNLYDYYSNPSNKRINYDSYKNYDVKTPQIPKYGKDVIQRKAKEEIRQTYLQSRPLSLEEYLRSEDLRLLHLDVNTLRNLHKARFNQDQVAERLHNPQLYYEYDTSFRTTRQKLYERYEQAKEKTPYTEDKTNYVDYWKNDASLKDKFKNDDPDKENNKNEDFEIYFDHLKNTRGFDVINDYMHYDKSPEKRKEISDKRNQTFSDSKNHKKNDLKGDKLKQQEEEYQNSKDFLENSDKSGTQKMPDPVMPNVSQLSQISQKTGTLKDPNTTQQQQQQQPPKSPKLSLEQERKQYIQKKKEIKEQQEKDGKMTLKTIKKKKFVDIFGKIMEDAEANERQKQKDEENYYKYEPVVQKSPLANSGSFNTVSKQIQSEPLQKFQPQQNQQQYQSINEQLKQQRQIDNHNQQPLSNQPYRQDLGASATQRITFGPVQNDVILEEKSDHFNSINNSPMPGYYQNKVEGFQSSPNNEQRRKRFNETEKDLEERHMRELERRKENSRSSSQRREKMLDLLRDMSPGTRLKNIHKIDNNDDMVISENVTRVNFEEGFQELDRLIEQYDNKNI